MPILSSKLLKTFTKTYKQIRLISDASFKAAVLAQNSAPLTIEEQKLKLLKNDQVRIQVEYCSVNSVDCVHFKNKDLKFPFIPGYELSGEVIEVGKNVEKDKVLVGDKVAALSPDEFGGFAQQCVVNMDDVWRIPTNINTKEAAVMIYGHSTAVYAFNYLCKLKENSDVLITAGPAGLGLAAVDVAANVFKAKVLGVVDSEERAELLRQRGAFHTIKFRDKILKDVHKKTKNKGADVVYDAVGEHMIEKIGSCVAKDGVVFHAAPYDYDLEKLSAVAPHATVNIINLNILRQKDKKLYKNVVGDTLELANEGIINAFVSATFDLDDINDAIKYIEDKKCTGKVLIEIDD